MLNHAGRPTAWRKAHWGAGGAVVDLATLVGLVAGTIVVLIAIFLGGDFGTFINLPSILIVVGGGVAATILRFSLSDVAGGFVTGLKIAFQQKKITPQMLIDEVEELARTAKMKGLIALDGMDIPDDFLKKGVQLCVDGLAFEFIQDALTRDRDLFIERLEGGEKVYRALGEAAPAFGMIGTLVGLVQMLSNMDDPSTIGPSMAVALLTTLYGALIASLMALPIADKLAGKIQTEYVNRSLVIEGVLQIQSKQNPDLIVEFLNAYVPLDQRKGQDDAPASAAA
jgi:chemotaxis protein MotA